MATIYVATDGSDSTGTGAVGAPYRTIQKGHDVASGGDTIHVKGDPNGVLVYDETVVFTKTNITFLGDPTDQPILDSNYTKAVGFQTLAGPSTVTIDNFEIRRYQQAGIDGYGQPPGTVQHNCVIQNCHIHHIYGRKSVSNEHSYGCSLRYGNWTVQDCEIHHIEGWNESTGIWFGYCKNHVADGNVIYSVRKEGIRSYFGNQGRIVNNRIFLVWFGLCPNEDAQSLWANNYISHCTGGLNPKHTNDPDGTWTVLAYWGLADDASLKYVRMWHNTIHKCSWAHLIHAININDDGVTGYTYKSDVRNNIFSGYSPAYFWDGYWARKPPNIVDYNVYSTADFDPPGMVTAQTIYLNGYDPTSPANRKTLAEVRVDPGLETNGLEVDPQLNDPDVGDLDYPDSSPVHNAGFNLTSLGSDWGTQMGARGLPDARIFYTPYPLTRIASSAPYGYSVVDENMFSGDQNMPLGTWITLDLGATVEINHVFGDNFTHYGVRNVKRIQVDVADGPSGPWASAIDDETYDSGGTSWKFEIPSSPTGRYARVTFVTSHAAASVDMWDVRLGFITNQPVDPGTIVTILYPSPTLLPSPSLYPASVIVAADTRGLDIPTSLTLDHRATPLAVDHRTTELILDG